MTGEITVASGASINHEVNASHALIVRVVDEAGLSFDKLIVVNVTDVNEAPVILSNGGAASASITVMETQTSPAIVMQTADEDANSTLIYSLSGADAALFTINPATGSLRFITPPDFETPIDADGDGTYHVIVTVSDGALTDSQALSIVVSNINDAPTDLLFSNVVGSLAEGTDTSTRIKLADLSVVDDGSGINLLSLGGLDAASFEIDAGVLYLRAGVLLDYDLKTSLTVNVMVDDASVGGSPDVLRTFTLNLINVNETPVITSLGGGPAAAVTTPENNTGVVLTVAASDPDIGDTLGYAIAGGADAALFVINATTGQLRFAPGIRDFEAPDDANGDGIYEVRSRRAMQAACSISS